jgi:signal peptidase II
MTGRTRQHTAAALTVAVVIAIDVISKRLAEQWLTPAHIPVPVLGDAIRFTLAYNRGAAFGMHVGDLSRIVFTAIALLILGVLVTIYRESASAGEGLKRLGLAFVAGGAVGNLIDRLRGPQGVVDFIDIGVGATRFWTFNVADSAVTIGTVLLLWTMRQDGQERPSEPTA